MPIVALDVDLRKIYAVSEDKVILTKAEPDPIKVINAISAYMGGALSNTKTILIEVASPVMYHSGPGAAFNTVRWALWNIAAASHISLHMGRAGYNVLVAPSHVWTKGHNLKVRHDVAKCTQKQKDLRECEAMMYYYHANPTAWLPLPEYLGNL